MTLTVLMFQFFLVLPLLHAQLSPGDAVVFTLAGSNPAHTAALVRVAAGTGVRSILTDFENPAQGPTARAAQWLAIESPTSVLIVDAVGTTVQTLAGPFTPVAIVRVTLPGGTRTIVSDLGNSSQWPGRVQGPVPGDLGLAMGPAGTVYFIGGGLYRIDLSTGNSTVVSDLVNPALGDVVFFPWAIAVESGGDILFLAGGTIPFPDRLYRVNPSSGQRTLVSQIAQGSQTAGFIAPPLFSSLAIEPSGNILVMDSVGVMRSLLLSYGMGALWRVNRATGAGTLLSLLGEPAEGARGSVGGLHHAVAVDGSGNILVPVVSAGTLRGAVLRIDPATGNRVVFSDFTNAGQGPVLEQVVGIDVLKGTAAGPSEPSGPNLNVGAGGATTTVTAGTAPAVRSGYAIARTTSGVSPFATAVFSMTQNGVVVSEAGIPASPATQRARIFIDYRTGVAAGSGTIDINTGFAIANPGSSPAAMTYTLRDLAGQIIAAGSGTLGARAHFAKFIHELPQVAGGFNLPDAFSRLIRFASLEVSASQPVSIVALRLTSNQRGETLLTSTPFADLAASPSTAPLYFAQAADGGGYTTTLNLLNTSGAAESGTVAIFDDLGLPISLRETGGTSGSSFTYSIAPGGSWTFQTDGSSPALRVGWIRLTPDAATETPVGAGVFSYSPAGLLVTESGVPSATLTKRARIYVDLSGNHDTGIAIANGASASTITLRAFQRDGSTPAGNGPVTLALPANGHTARFASQLIGGLPAGFSGVIELSSDSSFAALTLRSLTNGRGDFLLTTLPVAVENQQPPELILFPQVADGGGYSTQFIFISSSGAASVTVDLFGDDGLPINLSVNP